MSTAAALSKSTAFRSRPPRRAFSARRPGCNARRHELASTPTDPQGLGLFGRRNRRTAPRGRGRIRLAHRGGPPASLGGAHEEARPEFLDRGRRRGAPRSRGRSPRAVCERARGAVFPAAATPYNTARPTSTASAPSASALNTSVPRRTPPSTRIVSRSPTARRAAGRHIERRHRPIELPPAMIGHRDRIGADLGRAHDILDGEQTLDDQPARPAVADALHRVP